MTERVVRLPRAESTVRPGATLRCAPCGVAAHVETWHNTALERAIASGKSLHAMADAPPWAGTRAASALTLHRYFCPTCNTTLRVR